MTDRERVTMMTSQVLRHLILSGDHRVFNCGVYAEQVIGEVKKLLEDKNNECCEKV